MILEEVVQPKSTSKAGSIIIVLMLLLAIGVIVYFIIDSKKSNEPQDNLVDIDLEPEIDEEDEELSIAELWSIEKADKIQIEEDSTSKKFNKAAQTIEIQAHVDEAQNN